MTILARILRAAIRAILGTAVFILVLIFLPFLIVMIGLTLLFYLGWVWLVVYILLLIMAFGVLEEFTLL
mgnify:FL=1